MAKSQGLEQLQLGLLHCLESFLHLLGRLASMDN
jgi:hypothetical protein